MTDTEQLNRIAAQLRKWAIESRTGGWSTHQVDPMRKLADEIDEHLSRPFPLRNTRRENLADNQARPREPFAADPKKW